MHTPQETYGLIQEELRPDGWRLLVACMMLNQTSIKQVRGVIWDFFKQYPGPKACAQAKVEDVAETVRMLGLYNRRARALIRMSQDFLKDGWDDVQDFYGVGKYASDSYRIFILNELPASEDAVDDKELKAYVRWAHGCK